MEVKKDSHRYIIHEEHLLREDKMEYLKNKKNKKIRRKYDLKYNKNKIK